ncbi:MAG: hypothetical protein D6696_15830 [Acidobacteria bacterium]|nr:MAG: hypothetical protein D6696_15830 [Acidobacteriota bacterium]
MKRRALGLVLALLASAAAGAAAAESKDLFGWAERVLIGPGRLQLDAKLDTGADTSSLDAAHIRRIRRGNQRLIRFELIDRESGETITVERPLIRRATIKRHGGEHQRRPVVAIDVCLGTHLLRQIEVTLIDRSEFNYPLLLGRSALEGVAVVDPELSFTQKPRCAMKGSTER